MRNSGMLICCKNRVTVLLSDIKIYPAKKDQKIQQQLGLLLRYFLITFALK